MRVFVTGATGFVGSAVVRELLAAGHQVLGLARSEAAAAALQAAGAEAHAGDLENSDSLRAGVLACDGVIHTGFVHDFSRFAAVCEIDRQAILAMSEALEGTEKPMLVTSGIGMISKPGGLATEADRSTGQMPRIASDQATEAAAAKGVRVALLRLPPSTHGIGDHGFVPMLGDIALKTGVSVYAEEGMNYWPAVHRTDAARLYRLALESPFAPGTRFHAVAEEGIPFREIAAVIGRRLAVPVASMSREAAAAHFGGFAHFAAMDIRASAAWTQSELGWNPTQPGLIADIDQEAYFPQQ